MPDRYVVEFSTEAVESFASIRSYERASLRKAIAEHLSNEPTRISRSRIKRMVQPFWCGFRLRVGEYRVYYDVDEAAARVRVLRIHRKGSGTTPEELP